MAVPPVSGTSSRSRTEHPNNKTTESRLLGVCSVTDARTDPRSVGAASSSDSVSVSPVPTAPTARGAARRRRRRRRQRRRRRARRLGGRGRRELRRGAPTQHRPRGGPLRVMPTPPPPPPPPPPRPHRSGGVMAQRLGPWAAAIPPAGATSNGCSERRGGRSTRARGRRSGWRVWAAGGG